MKKEQRFETIYQQGNSITSASIEILLDKETGVQYLFVKEGYSGGLTALLDAEGKPVIQK